MKKLILFLNSSTMNLPARQVNEVLQKLARELVDSHSLEVRSISIASARDILPHLALFERAHRLIFSSMEPAMVEVLRLVRRELGLLSPAVFTLHGHASSGPAYFLPFDRLLLKHDEFIVAGKVEREILGLSFKNPRVIEVPWLVPPIRARKTGSKRCRRFVYVGRISLQKNLHCLICAFALLQERNPRENWELRIYGSEDGLGTPEFGVRSRGYLSYLKKLARKSGARRVEWAGFVDQRRLDSGVLREPHIFVSPSLHLGENFGIAAFRSIISGKRAVLSHWGGHRDLKRLFPGSIRTVPVWGGQSGPYVSPLALCSAMEKASEDGPVQSPGNFEKLRRQARAILAKSWMGLPKPQALEMTASYKRLRRRIRSKPRNSPLFTGYADADAQEVLRMMGMFILE